MSTFNLPNYVFRYDDPGKSQNNFRYNSSFATRNSKEFPKELKKYKAVKNCMKAISTPPSFGRELSGAEATKTGKTVFFDIEVDFDSERGYPQKIPNQAHCIIDWVEQLVTLAMPGYDNGNCKGPHVKVLIIRLLMKVNC